MWLCRIRPSLCCWVASLMPAVVGVAPDSLMAVATNEQHDLMRQAVHQLCDGVDLGQTVLRSIATSKRRPRVYWDCRALRQQSMEPVCQVVGCSHVAVCD